MGNARNKKNKGTKNYDPKLSFIFLLLNSNKLKNDVLRVCELLLPRTLNQRKTRGSYQPKLSFFKYNNHHIKSRNLPMGPTFGHKLMKTESPMGMKRIFPRDNSHDQSIGRISNKKSKNNNMGIERDTDLSFADKS